MASGSVRGGWKPMGPGGSAATSSLLSGKYGGGPSPRCIRALPQGRACALRLPMATAAPWQQAGGGRRGVGDPGVAGSRPGSAGPGRRAREGGREGAVVQGKAAGSGVGPLGALRAAEAAAGVGAGPPGREGREPSPRCRLRVREAAAFPSGSAVLRPSNADNASGINLSLFVESAGYCF